MTDSADRAIAIVGVGPFCRMRHLLLRIGKIL